MTLSDDGTRAYAADPTGGDMLILDTTQIQRRNPNAQAFEISRLTWKNASIPQNAIPFTRGGKPYVLEFDEYTQGTTSLGNSDAVGAARIIDISDERQPRVISNLRLQINQEADHKAAEGRPGHVQPRAGLRGALLQHPARARTRGSSRARSSPRACACSTSPTCCTPRRSATTSRRRLRRPRTATTAATTRCPSRRSHRRATRSGTPTARAGSTSCASRTGCGLTSLAGRPQSGVGRPLTQSEPRLRRIVTGQPSGHALGECRAMLEAVA